MDNMMGTPGQPQPMSDPVASDKPAGGLAGYLATTSGKLIVGGLILVVLLAVIGGLVYFFVLGGDSADTSIEVKTINTPVKSTTTSASAEASITKPATPPLDETFTFRNIFAPTVKPPVASTTASTTTGSTGSGSVPTDLPADTLYLQSVTSVNGILVATFLWNDTVYLVAEGDTLPGTPWKVLSLSETGAVMLYGDTQVSISVGQGITK